MKLPLLHLKGGAVGGSLRKPAGSCFLLSPFPCLSFPPPYFPLHRRAGRRVCGMENRNREMEDPDTAGRRSSV